MTRELTDQEFQLHALSILQRELGVEGFARFLRFVKGEAMDEAAEQVRAGERGEERTQ